MAGRADDMVIRPSLGPGERAAAPVRAREERRVVGGRKRRGGISRTIRAQRRARMARRRGEASKRRISRRPGRARRAGLAARAGGMAARQGTRAAVMNPIGLAVTALVVSGAVIARLASGRSFENMGENLSHMLLGDEPEKARASMDARQHIAGNENLARIAGQEGAATAQMKSIYDDIAKLRENEYKGASALRRAAGMQANGTMDILILRAKKLWLELWAGSGGDEKVEKLGRAWRERVGLPENASGR